MRAMEAAASGVLAEMYQTESHPLRVRPASRDSDVLWSGECKNRKVELKSDLLN
eukprot:m.20711 g.20711  ORF g.20711 m.20711 type:complete len:54 (-) comp3820_c0_seq1:37-198(-)